MENGFHTKFFVEFLVQLGQQLHYLSPSLLFFKAMQVICTHAMPWRPVSLTHDFTAKDENKHHANARHVVSDFNTVVSIVVDVKILHFHCDWNEAYCDCCPRYSPFARVHCCRVGSNLPGPTFWKKACYWHCYCPCC